MNHNLTAVALTLLALGLIAAFDIIPGAGFYAGIVMLTAGGGSLAAQFAMRTWPFLFEARSIPAAKARNAAPAGPWGNPESTLS
jgi:hypothetical protein